MKKGQKIRAWVNPPPFSGNARKKTCFFLWYLPLDPAGIPWPAFEIWIEHTWVDIFNSVIISIILVASIIENLKAQFQGKLFQSLDSKKTMWELGWGRELNICHPRIVDCSKWWILWGELGSRGSDLTSRVHLLHSWPGKTHSHTSNLNLSQPFLLPPLFHQIVTPLKTDQKSSFDQKPLRAILEPVKLYYIPMF